MRIGVITSMYESPWAGSEELWGSMVRRALQNGHDVMAGVYRWGQLDARVEQLRDGGASLSLRPIPRFGRIGEVLLHMLRPFEEMARFSPDVLCISQGGTYDMPTGIEFGQLKKLLARGRPYVIVCQANDPNYIPSPDQRDAVIEYFRRARRICFVSDENRISAERQLAVDLPNAVVLRNPVNLLSTKALPWPAGQELRMACVARLRAFPKGQDILLEALASPRCPRDSWHLSLYGSGPDSGYLSKLASHYGISDRVTQAGHVSDIGAVWSDHHLLVLATRLEGTPLALVEAMLCGRPAVVTDVGGNAEWIDDGVTGFVAEAPTTRSFGHALRRAWAARERLAEMGRLAFQMASAKLDNDPGGTLLNILVDVATANAG